MRPLFRFRQFFLSQEAIACAIGAILCDAVLVALHHYIYITDPTSHIKTPLFQFEFKIDLALLVGAPLLVMGIIQIHFATLTTRAGLIKEFAANLHTEDFMSESFYYLVYSYSDALYEEFTKAKPEEQAVMQVGREQGRRLFDPRKFQGSEEERRLDAFLGFMDIIGFHYYRGVLPMRDIAGSMGFHLQAIATRQVIVDYRLTTKEWWLKSKFTQKNKYSPVGPFRYLDILLEDYRKFCEANEKYFTKINQLSL